jgi:hypothetical protein
MAEMRWGDDEHFSDTAPSQSSHSASYDSRGERGEPASPQMAARDAAVFDRVIAHGGSSASGESSSEWQRLHAAARSARDCATEPSCVCQA